MSERQLNVLVMFPSRDPFWSGSENRIRKILAGHNVEIVYSSSQAAPYVSKAEIMIGIFLSDEYARQARHLKWIQALGTGVDNILSLPSLRSEVLITNARGIHGGPVSEAALALMFSVSRDIRRNIRGQEKRRWDPFNSVLLEGKTVGILGTGVIAEALAGKCKALGMTVVGLSAAPRRLPGFDRISPRADLARLAGEFDFFVLLTPLTPSTRGIVSADVLRAMKPTAYLINVGRGGLVDEPALITALREGRIAGAGLDCFAREPLPADSPLWSLENVVMTPHMAGRHDGYMDDALDIFEVNLRHYLAGKTADMVNVVSREALTR